MVGSAIGKRENTLIYNAVHGQKVTGRRALGIGGRRVIELERLNVTFGVVARGTVAEGAELHVEVLPVGHHCRGCGNNFDGPGSDVPCPACGHPHTELVGGEEIPVVDVQVDDTAA